MDAIKFDNTYASLPDDFYIKQIGDPAPKPAFIKINSDLAKKLGLDPAFLESAQGLAMLSGGDLPKGADPLAMAYAGHQFGGWSPRLGDGRAILLGEIIGSDNIRYDIHLKGSGQTPFSRGGDGKAAIGPVIREYIVSEAMAALGVPTTRALAALTTGETVIREDVLPGAIFARVAQSHIRVGTFQYFYAKNDRASLQTLADYVIDRHYPETQNRDNPIAALYAGIVKRQARLIPLWLKYGFIHGVMNTDNCQIAGETIDYGPCAFMDDFNPNKVFSSIDQKGRYAWGNQPHLAHWNLMRLGEALMPVWGDDDDTTVEGIKATLDIFNETFNSEFQNVFNQKLGLSNSGTDNSSFIGATFKTMTENKTDFTLFFSHLRRLHIDDHREKFIALFSTSQVAEDWLKLWEQTKTENGIAPDACQAHLDKANPIYIPRNHRVEEAIQAATQGNYTLMHRLHEVLQNPFDEQLGAEGYEAAPEPNEIVQQTFCGT